MSLTGGLTASLTCHLSMGLGGGMAARSAAWTPGDLTGLAATLLPAESLAGGLLWQNAAKTVPATADGDPVRVAVCPYTAVEFTAASDAARPLLWEEGDGLWSLAFDGIDDGFGLAAAITLAGDFECWVQGFRPASDHIWLCGAAGTASPQFRVNFAANTTRCSNDAATAATNSSAFPTVCPAVMSLGYSRSGSTVSYYQGESAIGTPTLSGTVSPRRLGFGGEFGAAVAGRVGGLVICTAAQSAGTRADLVTYLGAL